MNTRLKTFALTRFSVALAVLLSCRGLSSSNAAETSLTDATISGCMGGWDTKAGLYWADMLFYEGSDSTTNYLNGRDGSYATTNLSIPLTDGTNVLRFFAQGGEPCGLLTRFDINLVFERHSVPDISAEGLVDVLYVDHPIFPNFHATRFIDSYEVSPASRLVYTNRAHSHTIMLVSARFSPFADGYLGEISLVKSPIREILRIRASHVEISFDSISNKTYQLYYRPLLVTNLWQPLNEPIIGTGQRILITDEVPESEVRRFYRLEKIEDGGNP